MRKLLLIPFLIIVALGTLMLPGFYRLPKYRRTSEKGMVTIDDAVHVCQQSGLQGWQLVAYAQRLVRQKFAFYSTINLWDSPARAFIYGMGYCTQYNLAFKQLLDRLGFKTQAVFCPKVQVHDNTDWTMGHTWLRVTLNGDTRDVCAGRFENEPGQVHFTPLMKVLNGRAPLLFLSHIGVILFCGVLEWKALLSKSAPPDWAYREMR